MSCKPVNHHVGVSAFADFAVVSEASCVLVPKSLPFEQAALFGCAVLIFDFLFKERRHRPLIVVFTFIGLAFTAGALPALSRTPIRQCRSLPVALFADGA